MKRTRAQNKAGLMAHPEALIGRLLDWDEETERLNPIQIEEVVLRLRSRFGERLAEMVAEEQEAVQPAEPPVPPLAPCVGPERRDRSPTVAVLHHTACLPLPYAAPPTA